MSGKIVHSCDGESWQHFDVEYPDFASDTRNVRLAIATDGRFAIGNGAVRAADVRAAAKEGSVRPPSHYLAQEVAHLRRENARLQQDNRDKDSALQQNKVTTELILVHIFEHMYNSFQQIVFFMH